MMLPLLFLIMKKLLALVLALVMTLGLATVGASAAYSDASSINEDYSEAIDVMSMIGVFSGMDDGSFNPTGALTREQGAKILTYMLLGKTGGDALTAGTAPYSDVAADRWSAGSIAYCTSEGIIAGDGKGSFNPTDELTGYAFAKMLLCALGYDAKIEGLTGNDWQINASKLAITAGLNDKLEGLAFGSVMTREKAAQMAFNAEVGKMVYYADKGTEITTTDGTSIVVGASAAAFRTNAATGFADTLNDTGTWTQFAEVYASKLTRAAAATYQNGLAGHTYTYGGDKSAWAMDGSIVATVTDGTSIAKLVDNTNAKYIGYAMNGTGVATDATMNAVDGGTASTNVGAMTPAQIATALTATYDELRGVEIVFQDTDNDNDWDNVAVVMNTLAKLSGAPTEKASGSVTFVTVPGIAGLMTGDVKAENVFGYEDLAKGDYVQYHTDGTRWYLTKCESITGTVTAHDASSITVDGSSIKMSQIKGISDTAASIYTAAKGEADTTVYKDLAGYVVKAVVAESSIDLSNTLYVVSAQASGYAVQAKVVKADGTYPVITVAKVGDTSVSVVGDVTVETFYTFTTNSDGTYNLKTIPASKGTQATLTPTDAD